MDKVQNPSNSESYYMLCEHFNLVSDSKNMCSKEWVLYPAEFQKIIEKLITDICKKYMSALSKEPRPNSVILLYYWTYMFISVWSMFTIFIYIHSNSLNSHLTVPLSSPEAKRFSSITSKQYNGLLKQKVHSSLYHLKFSNFY
jgi:hypothetical protein